MATLCITIIALVLVGIAVGVGKSSDENTIGMVTTNSPEKDLNVLIVNIEATNQVVLANVSAGADAGAGGGEGGAGGEGGPGGEGGAPASKIDILTLKYHLLFLLLLTVTYYRS